MDSDCVGVAKCSDVNKILQALVPSGSSSSAFITALQVRIDRSTGMYLYIFIYPRLSMLTIDSLFFEHLQQSNTQAINFQLLQAPPLVINFSGDLKYSMSVKLKL